MKRTLVVPNLAEFPAEFHPLLSEGVYDSSCSSEARVWFLDREDGFYLKRAPKGTLKTEGEMTAYFHSKGLGAEVLSYLSTDADWLLTRRVAGEDCTHAQYLADPLRLCDGLAEALRQLHEISYENCPVPDRIATYLATAEENYRKGLFDLSFFTEARADSRAEDVWRVVSREGPRLRREVLLHGDYCLPNIMLENWKLSGFIDLGNGGVGDRHIDLFWGIWTLKFNLKTDRYRDRFLDAYGRDVLDPARLCTVSAVEVFG